MNWTDLNSFAAALFITGITVFLGGVAVVGVWLTFVDNKRSRIPFGPVHTLAFAVVCDLLALLVVAETPDASRISV